MALTKVPSAMISGVDISALGTLTYTSFTPTFSFATPGTSSWSYSVQSGIYVKIDDIVFFSSSCTATPTIGTGSGVLQMSLPFTSSFATPGYLASLSGTGITWPAGYTSAGALINASSVAQIRLFGTGNVVTNLQASHITTGTAIAVHFGGWFPTAS